MIRPITLSVIVTFLSLAANGQTPVTTPLQISVNSERATAEEFKSLMQTVAEGWNEGDAKKAADCYTEDAIYSSPPDSKHRKGRQILFEFFGGDKGRDAPMKMTWHHLAFDEESQIGFGEYTFKYKDYQAHGTVAIKVRHRKIANWREYEIPSNLSWGRFVGENMF
jgi:ketosteroid isomerase-like protein